MQTTVKHTLTLADYLRALHPDTSKNAHKKLLEHDRVKVNGVVVRLGKTLLQPGDRVEISRKMFRQRLHPELDILYEDEHLVVLHKKQNLLTIATEKEREKTVYAYLASHVKNQNPDNKIFIVHRLDRDASGLLVFARSETVKRKLQEQFRSHATTRGYIALVEGRVQPESGTLENHLAENRAYKVYVTGNARHGKLAVTHFRVVRRVAKYSWLEIKTETGRKHQIRVQLAAFGHPLIGDKEYGSTRNPLNRLGLHAHLLGFEHPVTGRQMKFEVEAPLPFRRMFALASPHSTAKPGRPPAGSTGRTREP